MRYLIIITLLLAASSCQKEIDCPWGNCDQPQFKSFPVQERGGYDIDQWNLDRPYVNINGFVVMIHPDYYNSLLGKDSITINLPDSAGEYVITEKFYYTGFNGEKLWAFQIGGTDQGWAGHEYSTYFALVDSVQYIERQTFNFKQ